MSFGGGLVLRGGRLMVGGLVGIGQSNDNMTYACRVEMDG